MNVHLMKFNIEFLILILQIKRQTEIMVLEQLDVFIRVSYRKK
jgi:hypothetical protein